MSSFWRYFSLDQIFNWLSYFLNNGIFRWSPECIEWLRNSLRSSCLTSPSVCDSPKPFWGDNIMVLRAVLNLSLTPRSHPFSHPSIPPSTFLHLAIETPSRPCLPIPPLHRLTPYPTPLMLYPEVAAGYYWNQALAGLLRAISRTLLCYVLESFEQKTSDFLCAF